MLRTRWLRTVYWIVLTTLMGCRPKEAPFILLDHKIPCTILLDLQSYRDVQTVVQDFAQDRSRDSELYFRALAAIELRHYLAKMSQRAETSIPIYDDRVPVIGNIVMVGLPTEPSAYGKIRTQMLKRWRHSRDLSDDGMRFDVFHQDQCNYFVLSGRTAVSTLYAVYDWLSGQGVRWVAPGKDGEIIPIHSAVFAPAHSFYKRPAMRWRGYIPGCEESLSSTLDPVWLQWLLRNRLNVVACRPEDDAVIRRHGIYTCRPVLPPTDIAEREAKICVVQPQLSSMLQKWLATAAPYADILVIDASSIRNWCDCDRCAHHGNKIDKELTVISMMAEVLYSAQQDGRIPLHCQLFGIIDAGMPENSLPQNWRPELIKLAMNIFPRCYDHSLTDVRCTEVNYSILKAIAFWLKQKKIGELGILEGYHTAEFAGLPLALLHGMGQELPFFKEIGIDFLLAHQPDFRRSGINALLTYQMARQCWQDDFAVDALQSDFFSVYYADISQLMQEYYHMLQEAMANIVAWRYELPLKVNALAETGFDRPLLPLDLFRRHFTFNQSFIDENAGTDWQRTYQLIHDARHVLDEALTRSVSEETKEHLNDTEMQWQFAEMTITLYDNLMRVLTLPADEPEMRQEAAIRLREVVRKMSGWRLPRPSCGATTALEASGIAPACETLLRLLEKEYPVPSH